MRTVHALLLTTIATTMVGCLNNPRNDSFLEGGTWEPIPIDGLTMLPNEIVRIEAFNFTTNNWDTITTTVTASSAFTRDNWYAFEGASKVLPLDYWEALTQSPTYRRRAKVRAVFAGSQTPFAYFNEGEETDQCIIDNYEESGTVAARTNCRVPDQGFANIYSCKFPPCTPWF
jgi:hypothetical protein